MSSSEPETQVFQLINTRNKLERLHPIYKRGYKKLPDMYRIKLEKRRSRVRPLHHGIQSTVLIDSW